MRSDNYDDNFSAYYIDIDIQSHHDGRMPAFDGKAVRVTLTGVYSWEELFEALPALRRRKVTVTHDGYQGFPRRPRASKREEVEIRIPVDRQEWILDRERTEQLADSEVERYFRANPPYISPWPEKPRRFLFQQSAQRCSGGYEMGGWAGIVEDHISPPNRSIWREKYPDLPLTRKEEEELWERNRPREELPVMHSILGDEDGD